MEILMKFGMPTLVECSDIRECCDVALSCGLDFVELNMSFPQYQPQSLKVDDVAAFMRETGLFFTIHADEMMNPFDFNDKVSACYFDTMRDTLRFAVALRVPVINMHLLKGVYVTLPGKVILLNDVYREKYIEKVKQFIKMCDDELDGTDTVIAIENVDSNPFTESQLEALALFMESPHFALTLDTGHELCLGFADSHVFETYPERLAHMHLHDARGKSAHLPLGTGDVDIAARMGMLREGQTCLIEVKTIAGLRESVEYLRMHKGE